MSHLPARRVLAAILVAGLAASPRAAVAASRSFSESTSVVVVEVPVQVVKDGEPVRGLTVNDFELYDGRKKVNITGFDVLDLATAAPGALGPSTFPTSARRHFLLLFDLVFADPNALLRARDAAKAILSDLHPTDLVSVATYSAPTGPQMVLGFTPDRAQAAAAIDSLGLPHLFNPATDPLRLVLTDTGSVQKMAPGGGGPKGPGGDGTSGVSDQAVLDQLKNVSILSSRAEESVDQLIVRNMTQSFAGLARMMGSVDGRKYVVLLSEGFDSALVTGSGRSYEAGQNDLQSSIDAAGDPDQITGSDHGTGSDSQYGDTRTQNLLDKMLTEFQRADCQIQAVDIAGLRALANEGRITANGRESLATMAKSTGGELYENTNDLRGAMGQMLRRTAATYVLSFQPTDLKADDTFHKLRVEVKNARGARVVHRPGYYAPRPYEQQAPLQKILDTGDAVMGQEGGSIGAAVLAAPFAVQGDRAYVPVVVEVNGESLLAGKHDAKLPVEIYAYAFDEAGSVQDYLTQSFALDASKAEAALKQSGFKFFGHMELPKGKYTLRTLVRNGATGATGLRVDEVVVPGLAAGEAALLPAFFPETPGKWVMVRETLPAGAPQPPYPFMLKGAPYIPASRPVLVSGQPASLVLQGYNLAPGALKASAAVLTVDGQEIPGGAIKLAASEGGGSGALRISATFEPPALQPGEYRLRVTVTDGAGKAQASMARFAVGGGSMTPGGR